jgi:hypothetical protein
MGITNSSQHKNKGYLIKKAIIINRPVIRAVFIPVYTIEKTQYEKYSCYLPTGRTFFMYITVYFLQIKEVVLNYMIMKRYALLPLAGILVIGYSCSKKSSSKSNTELISASAWKYDTAAIDMNKDGVAETPLPAGYLEDCDKDNVVTLKSDGTGTVDEGLTKCDPANPQSINISWAFKDNEKVINIPQTIFGSITGDAQIKELTATKLKLLKTITINIGIQVTVNVIVDLKH